MAVQLSVLTIVGYGPWTLTLGSDREHELQMLQASLYREIQRLFSERGCLAFQNRADEMFAISTGLGLQAHREIQDVLVSKFQNVRLRIVIGSGATPVAAANDAARSLVDSHRAAGAVDEKYMIFGSPLDYSGAVGAPASNTSGGATTILHVDVDGLSTRKSSSAYATSLLIFRLYSKMSRYFYDHESLAFFMGGDNFMIASSESAKMAARKFVDMIRQEDGIKLNCGIGTAVAAREAACLATESLDMIRKMRDASLPDNDQSGNADAMGPKVYEHATKKHF